MEKSKSKKSFWSFFKRRGKSKKQPDKEDNMEELEVSLQPQQIEKRSSLFETKEETSYESAEDRILSNEISSSLLDSDDRSLCHADLTEMLASSSDEEEDTSSKKQQEQDNVEAGSSSDQEKVEVRSQPEQLSQLIIESSNRGLLDEATRDEEMSDSEDTASLTSEDLDELL
ncbi:hypothetical protein WMY93_002349 [Mugilogobius chulae]|uniref:Uncharacterized protein n=1 Tax=Mugilogobius chulae TaxID=88201 RepID=A0AAW0PTL3_9GOBI